MGQRARYWSNTKFAQWIRGTKKPMSATMEGWDEWDDTAHTAHPFRYWIAETALNTVQNALWYPIDKLYDIKYWINNRYVTKTHALTSTLKRGQWYDYDTRIFNCLFDELTNYVAVEVAMSHVAWGGDDVRVKYHTPFWATGWFKWRTWRCEQAGLDNLKWQAAIIFNEDMGVDADSEHYGKPTDQAISAQAIIDLYIWWTQVRPNRPDPYEASGWAAVCELGETDKATHRKRRRFSRKGEAPDHKAARDAAYKKLGEIEAAYTKEDDEMVIKLVNARRSMWT
jgi:hypothetical protein